MAMGHQPSVGGNIMLNMLLLGKTGCGKSTWINAFANYMKFDTMELAEIRGRIPIAARFSVSMDDSDVDVTFQSGTDPNENNEDTSESCTKLPVCYSFSYGNVTVNLIDTPGFSDTNGKEHDKEHIDHILQLLSTVDHLNAVCILCSTTERRLTAEFKYWLSEILSNLHEDAINNIVFCFTNAKATNFKADDAKRAMNNFFTAHKLNVKVDRANTFCFENEPVRYIIACQQNKASLVGITREEAKSSWTKSAQESQKMLQCIRELKPFPVFGMQSINKAKRTINIVSRIVVDMAICMTKDLQEIREKEHEVAQLEMNTSSNQNWLRLMRLRSHRITVKELSLSRTVCASNKCITYNKAGEKVYNQVCDNNCRYAAMMYWCEAFDWRGNCKRCGCSYKLHEWQTSVREVEEVEEDLTGEVSNVSESATPEQKRVVIRGALKKLREREYQTLEEKRCIIETCAKLSNFVNKSAVMASDSKNDLGEYLTKEIDVRSKYTERDSDKAVAGVQQQLSKIKKEYDDKVTKLENYNFRCSPADVPKMIENMYALPLKGEELKDAVMKSEQAIANAMRQSTWKTPWLDRGKATASRLWNKMFGPAEETPVNACPHQA